MAFNSHFLRQPGLAGMSVSVLDFIDAKDDGRGGDNWSYKSAKLQSNRHHQQTNT